MNLSEQIKAFPLLVADPTTNEQNMLAWRDKVLAKLEPLMAHLQNFPTDRTTKLSVHYAAECERWKEELDKHLAGVAK